MIRVHLTAKQRKLAHAILNGFAAGVAIYVVDSLHSRSVGGPSVVIGSLVSGALIAGLSKGLGVWLSSGNSAPQ